MNKIKNRRQLSRLGSIYAWIMRNNPNLLDKYFPIVDKKTKNYWNLERCKEDSLKYKTRGEWREASSGYSAAHRNRWLDECYFHMVEVRKPKGYWTLERCKEAALKYQTRSEWQKAYSSGYRTAYRNGWLDECCAHMEDGLKCYKPSGYWTLERCKEDALKYKTRNEWQKAYSSGYHTAYRNGWLDECCAHMKPLTNSKKKATLNKP